MIFSNDTIVKIMKRYYIKSCINTFIIGATLYTLYNIVMEHDKEIENLTKRIKGHRSKGE